MKFTLSPFAHRHIGPSETDIQCMLDRLGHASLEEMLQAVMPESIRLAAPLRLPSPLTEREALAYHKDMARANRNVKSFIGQGFHNCFTPPVIRRNILENPCWYTQYTPYQAEIAQGRLEALLNFQTLVSDLTSLPVANASLLDEASAAAEAMLLCHRARPRRSEADTFLLSDRCHPQILAVVQTRARALRIRTRISPVAEFDLNARVFGLLLQVPDTDGRYFAYQELCEEAHAVNALVAVAADPLALTLFKPPGEWGADIAVGTTQRLGMGMGMGGPHAAFMATRATLKRMVPGRIVGVARDSQNRPALRLALQTREQHIRRETATSNICTAQVLPAIVASMYAVYHGPQGLQAIAQGIVRQAARLRDVLRAAGCAVTEGPIFDGVKVHASPLGSLEAVWSRAQEQGYSLRRYADGALGISLDETAEDDDLACLAELLAGAGRGLADPGPASEPERALRRASAYLTHPVFASHRSETALLRYIVRLQKRDLSLADSMIPLGSCTMKLNAATELEPITWEGFAAIHPYEPKDNVRGYQRLTRELAQWLAEITGFAAVSLQPNAGSQGEYAGLLAIRAYFEAQGAGARRVCLIPSSAHGTNPASAQMAGLQVVEVACDAQGNVDLADLRRKADAHADALAAFMVTYPSTHGVFEPDIRAMADVVHAQGGQVYIDGANMNAMVGLSTPARIGGDICHLNLHKTFCIPHGGGGPGMGPVCAAAHLVPYLPVDPNRADPSDAGLCVAGTDFGSGSILPISHSYIAMMGAEGLAQASAVAILAANYVAVRLERHYPVLYRNQAHRVAHECIIDLGWIKPLDLTVDDVAKRLIDYGFHAPTVSWPVPFTMMIEPTECENLQELDRFCEALIRIRQEIEDVATGHVAAADSVLRHAPYAYPDALQEPWPHSFARSQAALPADWLLDSKFWPAVSRIDNVWGDRNFACVCPPVAAYAQPA